MDDMPHRDMPHCQMYDMPHLHLEQVVKTMETSMGHLAAELQALHIAVSVLKASATATAARIITRVHSDSNKRLQQVMAKLKTTALELERALQSKSAVTAEVQTAQKHSQNGEQQLQVARQQIQRMEQERQHSKAELQRLRDTLRDSKANLDQMGKRVSAADSDVSKKEREMCACKEEMSLKDAELIKVRGEWSKSHMLARDTAADIKSLHAQEQSLRKQLKCADAASLSAQEELTRLQALVRQHTANNDDKAKALAALREALAKSERLLAAKNEAIHRVEALEVTHNRELDGAQAEAQGLCQLNRTLNHELTQQRALTDNVPLLQQQLVQRDTHLTSLRKSVQQVEESLSGKEAELNKTHTECKGLRDELVRTRKELDLQSQNLLALRASPPKAPDNTHLARCRELVRKTLDRLSGHPFLACNHALSHDLSAANQGTTLGISFENEQGFMVIKHILVGGPAFYSKRIDKEDCLIAIDGQKVGTSCDLVVEALLGSNIAGSRVKLAVQKATSGVVEEVVLERVANLHLAHRRKVFDSLNDLVDLARKTHDDALLTGATRLNHMWSVLELDDHLKHQTHHGDMVAVHKACDDWLAELQTLLDLGLDLSGDSSSSREISALRSREVLLGKQVQDAKALHSSHGQEVEAMQRQVQIMTKSVNAKAEAVIIKITDEAKSRLSSASIEMDSLRHRAQESDKLQAEAVFTLQEERVGWATVKGELETKVLSLTDELEQGKETVKIVKMERVKAQRSCAVTKEQLDDSEAKHRLQLKQSQDQVSIAVGALKEQEVQHTHLRGELEAAKENEYRLEQQQKCQSLQLKRVEAEIKEALGALHQKESELKSAKHQCDTKAQQIVRVESASCARLKETSTLHEQVAVLKMQERTQQDTLKRSVAEAKDAWRAVDEKERQRAGLQEHLDRSQREKGQVQQRETEAHARIATLEDTLALVKHRESGKDDDLKRLNASSNNALKTVDEKELQLSKARCTMDALHRETQATIDAAYAQAEASIERVEADAKTRVEECAIQLATLRKQLAALTDRARTHEDEMNHCKLETRDALLALEERDSRVVALQSHLKSLGREQAEKETAHAQQLASVHTHQGILEQDITNSNDQLERVSLERSSLSQQVLTLNQTLVQREIEWEGRWQRVEADRIKCGGDRHDRFRSLLHQNQKVRGVVTGDEGDSRDTTENPPRPDERVEFDDDLLFGMLELSESGHRQLTPRAQNVHVDHCTALSEALGCLDSSPTCLISDSVYARKTLGMSTVTSVNASPLSILSVSSKPRWT